MLENTLRVRCRNQRCRSKLPIPTDNDHKAFCTPYCYNQFYHWKCAVCEKSIQQRSRRHKMPKHCHARDCRLAFKNFPETYLFPKEAPRGAECDLGSRSAHFTGVKFGVRRVTEAEWRERDAADEKYVAEDEERLRTVPVDASGNYPPQTDDQWIDWPADEGAP